MQRIILLVLLQVVTISLLAVPARPGRRLVTLPDGTVREVVIRGDERSHWLETLDGQLIGERTTNSSLIQREQMMTSHALYNSASGRQHLSEVASASTSKASAFRLPSGNFLLEGTFPTTGKRKLLALLINFANTTPTYPRERFEAMLNAEGYNGVGSFRDYYLDQSFGQLDIETTVTPWITVSQPKHYYNIDNTPSLIAEALAQIDSSIDLRDYDNDHDGILDGLIVIHAGQGQEASGDPTDIWSHSSTIYGMQYDGISVYRYTIEPEQLHNGPSTIGVFCHEFGHNLGALDYYDTNYSSDGAYGGTGPWDLMGEGAWNGPTGEGDYPAPFTAWQRWQFGWIEPTVLDASTHVTDNSPEAHDGTAYRMNTTTEGDYYILENIQPLSPWTQCLPGHGLVVTHVVESIFRQRMPLNSINASYPQGIYTVCADANTDPVAGLPSSYGDLTSSATPFPGSRHNITFSDETLPSTHSQDGRRGYIALQNITETERCISFDYIQGEAPQRPIDLVASVQRGIVTLSWTFPYDKQQPLHCRIFRDGQLLATLSTPGDETWTYADPSCSSTGLVAYSVDATYPDNLTSAVSTVATRIPQQVATDFQAVRASTDAQEEQLSLSWSIPNEISRCTNDLNYQLVEHYASTLAYAHRFRADDLLPYVGQQIRSVTFLPQQRSTDASYKVCVWRIPAVQGEPCPMTITPSTLELVSQRNVSEYSPTYLRTLALTTRPTIELGYDYVIGIEVSSKVGFVEVVTDQSELQNDYGNLMSIGGGTWQIDPQAKGNYILSATLTGSAPDDCVQSLILTSSDPSTQGTSTIFTNLWRPYDVDADLFFPLGFTIYCRDVAIAETTSCSGMSLPLEALAARGASADADEEVTLALVATYKGNNESRALEVTLPIDETWTGCIPPRISSAASLPRGAVYDLFGRIVTFGHSQGHPTSARQHGIYIHNGRKVIK